MLDKKHVVDIPEGAIVKSDRTVLWTIEKRYIKKKKYNYDVRRMIGKVLETNTAKMYPNDNYKEIFPDILPQASKKVSAPSYQIIGYYSIVRTIVERLPLAGILYDVFGQEDTDTILDYAMYQIAYESDVTQHFENCMKDKALFSEKLRSDSYLSDFFKNRIPAEKIDAFCERWCEAVIEFKNLSDIYLNVDGSNIDCEAEGVTLKERGHDKSGKKTTIVNMMYAVAPDGTPVTYHQYRGSVIDQTAVKYLILYFSHTKAVIKGFCADRGFCSKKNADMLRANGMDFVMMMTSRPEGFTEARDKLRDSIKYNVDKWIEGSELFGDSVPIKMFSSDTQTSYLHMYYDCKKGADSTAKLLRDINKARADALKDISKKKKPAIPNELKEYIHLREGRGPRTIQIEKEKIQDIIDDEGFHGLATSKNMTAVEAYKIYQARDSSEKQYMFMKSKLGLDKYRTGSDESIAGKQFVAFIAGIIRNEIKISSAKMLAESTRTDRYTVPAIIKELGTIRIKRLPGDVYALVMDLSTRDTFMLKHLGIKKKDLDFYAEQQNRRIRSKIL